VAGVQTQRFYLALATDGDVSQTEIVDVLDALGYHGIMVLDHPVQDHEHPCPSSECIDQLRAGGHLIPEGTDCCVCWGAILG
jgi:hypothetical protein